MLRKISDLFRTTPAETVDKSVATTDITSPDTIESDTAPLDTIESDTTDLDESEIESLEMVNVDSENFIDETSDDETLSSDIGEDYDIEELTEMGEDIGYIEHSPEIVGYSTREQQFAAYRLIANVIELGSSILDVGCGRGDFKVFYAQEKQLEYDKIDYAGIDINSILINAGKNIYPEIELYETDWMNIPDNLKKDWVININSLNLRYDSEMTDNWDYFTKTITSMYNQANRGVAVMLASDISEFNEGLVSRSPGEVLNWCQKTFGVVAVDHTYSGDMFTLIIYK